VVLAAVVPKGGRPLATKVKSCYRPSKARLARTGLVTAVAGNASALYRPKFPEFMRLGLTQQPGVVSLLRVIKCPIAVCVLTQSNFREYFLLA